MADGRRTGEEREPSVADDVAEDDVLLARLRELAAAADPVPPVVVEAALVAYETRDLDAELADLVADSAVDRPAAVVRGDDGPRLLSFELADVSVELEVTPGPAGSRRLLGQVAGAVVRRLVLDAADGARDLTADELGRFQADGVPAGPVRVRGELDDGRRVATRWEPV